MAWSRRSVIKGIGATAVSSSSVSSMAGAQSAKKIVYWGHNYASRVKIVNEIMAPGFKKETGVDVSTADFETNQNELKILTAWSGGSGGPDLVSVGDNNIPNYVYRKLVAPVDPTAFGFKTQDELVAAYEPGVLDGFIYGGKLYAIPMDLASISMYYRKDFFKEVGLDPDKPPTTWEEVTEMGKMLVKRDGSGRIVRAGWTWLARSVSSHFYYWGTLLPQQGVDFLNADGTKNNIDNDGGMAAFNYLYGTFHGTQQISALGLSPVINPIDDFGAGRAAMINSGFWLSPALEAQYPDVTYKNGVYGIARLPQFKNGKTATRLNPWAWLVSSQSAAQQDAWRFVAYMTARPENRRIWLTQAQYIQPWKGFSADPAMVAIPYSKVFLEDLKIGVPLPHTPRFNQLASAVARAYDRVSANGDKPDVVVPSLAQNIDDILQD